MLEIQNNVLSLVQLKNALQQPELTEFIERELSKLSLSSILEWQSRPTWISTWLCCGVS